MKEHEITTPLTDDTIETLRAGDKVWITGRIIAARDAAHKRMYETLQKGEALPVSLKNEVVYYVGPTPAKPGSVIGSAGPTTSGRMDAYTPLLLEHGLKGMIGKGFRSKAVEDSIIKNHAVYFAAIGGIGALISKNIKSYAVQAYGELGPEALAYMDCVRFPAIVAIDCHGNNAYKDGIAQYKKAS